MSKKSKKLKLNPSFDEIKRQSFDSRICDDLCEVILQFLPFNDKFRLESVSKQFQRTVFQKVFTFNIKSNYFDVISGDFKLQSIESVLKKCPNIQFLDFLSDYFIKSENINKYNLLIDLIIKYCNNLSQFYGYFDYMNDTIRGKFIEKFGSNLKYLEFEYSFDANILQLMPNIEELDIIMTFFGQFETKIEFKKLKKLNLRSRSYTQSMINGLTTFFESNPQIEDLSLYYFNSHSLECDLLLEQISRLKNLVKLNIKECFPLNDKLFEERLKQIALNCPKLKYIVCDIIGDIKSELLSPLKTFKNIKRLDLCLKFHYLFEIKNLSFKVFNELKDLTHLSFDFRYLYPVNNEINDTILANIAINSPKLKYLNIKNANFIASKETHIILSGMSSLETIKLNITNKKLRKIIETKLTEHKKFKTIELLK